MDRIVVSNYNRSLLNRKVLLNYSLKLLVCAVGIQLDPLKLFGLVEPFALKV